MVKTPNLIGHFNHILSDTNQLCQPALWMLAQMFANLADDSFFNEVQWYLQQQVLFAATS
jgi:hypothetical protein